MKRSNYLQFVPYKNHRLYFHSLRGNLFLLEKEYFETLDSFTTSRAQGPKDNQEIINDLKNAAYLIEDATDERDFTKKRNIEWMNRLPSGEHFYLLDLTVSEACNLGCAHCLHKCSVSLSESHGKKKFMDWETAKQSIDFFYKNAKKNGLKEEKLWVHFGSAEPLLNWEIIARSILYLNGLSEKIRIAINTNITLVDKEIAQFLKDYNVEVSTSLDGPINGNDAIRIYPDGRGTFNKIIEKLELFESIGYPLDGFSITINDLNFDYIDDSFIEWAKQKNFKGIATDIDLINMKNAARSIDECVEKLISLRKSCLSRGIENFGSWTTSYQHLVNGSEDGMPTFCRAVKGNNISVSPDGNFFICGHTTTQLGSLREKENVFDKIGAYALLVSQRLTGNDPMCTECILEGVCAGQCQITREVSRKTGNGREEYLCNFYKQVTMRLLQEKIIEEVENKNNA